MKNTKSKEIYIERSVKECFNLFTQEEHMKQWFSFGQGWKCDQIKQNLSTGGKLSVTMSTTNGQMTYDMQATYTNVLEPFVLEFVDPESRVYTVKFSELEGRTKVSFLYSDDLSVSLNGDKRDFCDVIGEYQAYCLHQ